jgi:Acetyltransferase (GNAT) family
MTRNQPLALVNAVERTLYESSSTCEGIEAHEIPLGVGEVVLRTQTGFAAAMPLRFPPSAVEESLAQAIEQVEAIVPWCLWVIGPSSQPPDLQQRFEALGFTVRMEWEGLALDDLSLPLPTTAGLVIEPLCWDNAAAYATAMAGGADSPYRAELLSQTHRFLRRSPQEVQIDVARLDGEIAGYSVLRLEPNGVAYLRNAMTVPAFRNRGVYLSLVAHRLAVAQTRGYIAAVLQAQTATSAPILIKRGFKLVCRLVGLARKRA